MGECGVPVRAHGFRCELARVTLIVPSAFWYEWSSREKNQYSPLSATSRIPCTGRYSYWNCRDESREGDATECYSRGRVLRANKLQTPPFRCLLHLWFVVVMATLDVMMSCYDRGPVLPKHIWTPYHKLAINTMTNLKPKVFKSEQNCSRPWFFEFPHRLQISCDSYVITLWFSASFLHLIKTFRETCYITNEQRWAVSYRVIHRQPIHPVTKTESC